MKVVKFAVSLPVFLFLVILSYGCRHNSATVCAPPPAAGAISENHLIPHPPGAADSLGGAAAAKARGDHPDSPYFKHRDYYTQSNTETLTILSGFRTFQQTTEVHCAPAAALMVEHYFGKTDSNEIAIGDLMHDADYRAATQDGAKPSVEWSTDVEQMARYFESIGWQTSSSLAEGKLENGATFDDFFKFKEWVTGELKAGTPIMVEWCDWGGHWQVIIGYDTLGSEWPGDDMLILADPYDISDHCQDGYYVFNAVRFFYMWQDIKYLPENQSVQPWVIVRPGSE